MAAAWSRVAMNFECGGHSSKKIFLKQEKTVNFTFTLKNSLFFQSVTFSQSLWNIKNTGISNFFNSRIKMSFSGNCVATIYFMLFNAAVGNLHTADERTRHLPAANGTLLAQHPPPTHRTHAAALSPQQLNSLAKHRRRTHATQHSSTTCAAPRAARVTAARSSP